MLRFVLLLATSLSLWGRPGVGQAVSTPLAVALSVVEKNGAGVQSFLHTALSALPDVTVVTADERADVVVRVVVICQPTGDDCLNATTYSLAITLSEPLTENTIHTALLGEFLNQKAVRSPTRTFTVMDSLARVLTPHLRGYEYYDQLWSISIGRNNLQHSITSFVADLDTHCFERHRIFERLMRYAQANDTTGRKLARRLDSPEDKWLCQVN